MVHFFCYYFTEGVSAMIIQKSAEDYLEAVLILQKKNGNARSVDIAGFLGVSKPSVSVAVKNLRENDYITVNDSGGLILTEKGREIADRMYERHQRLTEFLVRIGVNETVAEADACKIEHDLSDESFAALCRFADTLKK